MALAEAEDLQPSQARHGQVPAGMDPKPPARGGARDAGQVNLTEEQARIMVVWNGVEKCYNAQVAVDISSFLIVGNFLTQAGDGSQQVKPILEVLERQQEQLGNLHFVADTDYFSAANV